MSTRAAGQLHTCDLQVLEAARAEATKARKYSSEATRKVICESFKSAFNGKDPYDWQVDACEAGLLGIDCIVIAGTGAGKTLPFIMPLLVDKTMRKIVVIISPLNELEHDQVCFSQPGFNSRSIGSMRS